MGVSDFQFSEALTGSPHVSFPQGVPPPPSGYRFLILPERHVRNGVA